MMMAVATGSIVADKKWVLQLCHGYSPPFGDVARQWHALFEGTDYRVLTVFLTGAPDSQIKSLVGGEVIFLGFDSKALRGLKIRQIQEIRNLHKQYQFKFAIAHRYKSIYIASHLPKIKVFGVSHAYDVYSRFLRRRYVMSQSDRLFLIGVSNAIRDDARAALPRFPQRQIQTVYNHINYDTMHDCLLTKEAAREYLQIEKDAFVVGNVGRLHPDKDQATLIAAFAKILPVVPDARLLIMGEGRLRGALERQIEELGVARQVELKGRVPNASRLFRAFDLFALSSDYEPFGMVLLEAMAAGIPVISSNCGGAPEVLGDAGRLFPVANSEALAQALLGIYGMGQEERRSMVEALQERLKGNFTDEAVRGAFWKQSFAGELC